MRFRGKYEVNVDPAKNGTLRSNGLMAGYHAKRCLQKLMVIFEKVIGINSNFNQF